MPQQINLCSPALLKPKRYFSAQTMVQALGVFFVLGGVLCATWVWKLQQSTQEFNTIMASQKQEVATLQAAIARNKANALAPDAALQQQLTDKRNAADQREKALQALREGLNRPGWGHSDRLAWLASSIPAPVWVSDVKMDPSRFEATGFTLEPAALNEWVRKLATSPLMQDLQLATVRVESTNTPVTPAAAVPAKATARQVWSFNLLSALPPPPTTPVPAPGATSAGAKP